MLLLRHADILKCDGYKCLDDCEFVLMLRLLVLRKESGLLSFSLIVVWVVTKFSDTEGAWTSVGYCLVCHHIACTIWLMTAAVGNLWSSKT